MASDSIDVRYVAKLARIALTDEEVERFGAQLGDLLEHVRALEKLDTGSVAATAQVMWMSWPQACITGTSLPLSSLVRTALA